MSVEIVTYNRKAPFSKEVLEKIGSAKVRVEYGGGLGDVIYQVHHSGAYDELVNLKEGELGSVVLACHNPHGKELFEWIPTKGHIIVANTGFEDLWNKSWREKVNLPLEKAPGWREYAEIKPLTLYPSPADLPIIREVAKARPFIVFSPSGSSEGKSIPLDICNRIVGTVLERGFKVVSIGRTYKMFIGGEENEPHSEAPISQRSGLISMVDKLTVPGVSSLMGMAAGVIAPNTASLILSYCQWRPTLFVCSDFDWKTFVPDAPAGYMFRMKEPNSGYFHVSSYSDDLVSSFLEKL